MLCEHCKVTMISGTSYRERGDSNNRKRFHECKICKRRKYSSGINFQEILNNEKTYR